MSFSLLVFFHVFVLVGCALSLGLIVPMVASSLLGRVVVSLLALPIAVVVSVRANLYPRSSPILRAACWCPFLVFCLVLGFSMWFISISVSLSLSVSSRVG